MATPPEKSTVLSGTFQGTTPSIVEVSVCPRQSLQLLLKNRYCACRKSSPSFPSAKVRGGPDAKADASRNPLKSAPARPHGAARIFSPCWKRFPKGKRENDWGSPVAFSPVRPLLPHCFRRQRTDTGSCFFCRFVGLEPVRKIRMVSPSECKSSFTKDSYVGKDNIRLTPISLKLWSCRNCFFC